MVGLRCLAGERRREVGLAHKVEDDPDDADHDGEPTSAANHTPLSFPSFCVAGAPWRVSLRSISRPGSLTALTSTTPVRYDVECAGVVRALVCVCVCARWCVCVCVCDEWGGCLLMPQILAQCTFPPPPCFHPFFAFSFTLAALTFCS